MSKEKKSHNNTYVDNNNDKNNSLQLNHNNKNETSFNIAKSNISNGKEKSKEKSKLFVKSANRTINSNNTNNYEIKLLSDRTINKTKNRTLNKLSKLNIRNIKYKHDKNKSKNHLSIKEILL